MVGFRAPDSHTLDAGSHISSRDGDDPSSRHCERSEATQHPGAGGSWVASSAPPPRNDEGAGPLRLSLVFNDIAGPRPGLLAPSRADIAALLAFGRAWDGSRPLLLHCRMGISRSTAGALVLAAAVRPGMAEDVLAAALRAAAPCATPNARMIALADDLLGRGGRLIAAAQAIGRGADYAPYRMFALSLPARA